MRKLNCNIQINASRELVWKAIVTPELYNKWTSIFTSSSRFEGGWNKGDTIRFLAFNKDGQLDGMIAEIAESIYPTYISIKHLGYIYNGVDDTESEAVRSWAPAYENYTLEHLSDKQSLFILEQDVTDDYYDMFMDLWPKALVLLKQTAEELNFG